LTLLEDLEVPSLEVQQLVELVQGHVFREHIRTPDQNSPM
jgi:hypothetical protein